MLGGNFPLFTTGSPAHGEQSLTARTANDDSVSFLTGTTG
jgi:hypothetical protein